MKMLPTGFANLIADRSSILDIVKQIDNWCVKHEELSEIDPRRLARDMSVSQTGLTEALFVLVDKGVFDLVFRVETQQGHLLSDNYQSMDEVPKLRGEVVPVFVSSRGAK